MAAITSTLDAVMNQETRRGLPINLQLFAHGGGGNEGGTDEDTGGKGNEGGKDNTDPADKGGKDNTDPADKGGKDKGGKDEKSNLDKYIQSQIDKGLAAARKELADTKKALEALQKEKLTDDEVAELERKKHEKELADREKAVTDKENRYFAIKAIKDAGLDDGSDKALALVDLVVTGNEDTEETITAKVKAVGEYISAVVAVKVDERFKNNGRNPNGSNDGGDDKDKDSIAVQLGKQKAEQNKKANDVLAKFGIGGK